MKNVIYTEQQVSEIVRLLNLVEIRGLQQSNIMVMIANRLDEGIVKECDSENNEEEEK